MVDAASSEISDIKKTSDSSVAQRLPENLLGMGLGRVEMAKHFTIKVNPTSSKQVFRSVYLRNQLSKNNYILLLLKQS